jgi:hypothetical protein
MNITQIIVLMSIIYLRVFVMASNVKMDHSNLKTCITITDAVYIFQNSTVFSVHEYTELIVFY